MTPTQRAALQAADEAIEGLLCENSHCMIGECNDGRAALAQIRAALAEPESAPPEAA